MDAPRKRRRANTNGDSAAQQVAAAQVNAATSALGQHTTTVPGHDLSECLEALDAADNGDFSRRLLLQLANSQPGTAATVRRAYDVHIRRQTVQTVRRRREATRHQFDRHSQHIFAKINKHYSMSASSEIPFQLYEVSDLISYISEEAVHASFGTKQSGLEMLHKIGKSICMSKNSTLGHEIRKLSTHFFLIDAMEDIVSTMSDEECEKMCNVIDGRSTFLEKMKELHTLTEKMKELHTLTDDFCVFEGLGVVIAVLAGETKYRYSEVEGEDDDSEDDDDLEVRGEVPSLSPRCLIFGEEDDKDEDEGREKLLSAGLQFASYADKKAFLKCYDSDNAPKNDRKSRATLRRLGFLN